MESSEWHTLVSPLVGLTVNMCWLPETYVSQLAVRPLSMPPAAGSYQLGRGCLAIDADRPDRRRLASRADWKWHGWLVK